MASLTVYTNPDPKSHKTIPFLLDIQNGLLSGLDTRVVVPLYLKGAASSSPMTRLTPVVSFKGKTLVAMVPELAGVSKRHLGAPAGDLAMFRAEVIAAIDLLVSGF